MSKARPDAQPAGALIERLEYLPLLPREAREMLAALGDPDIDLAGLVRLIERSPSLATRIVGVARSAFFAGAAPARSIADAVIRVLGLRLVRDLCIGIILAGPLRIDQCAGFDPPRYWLSAVGTATLAQNVWARLVPGPPTADASAYLAGLLHNVGVLALAHACPAALSRAFVMLRDGSAESLRDAESMAIGLDHVEAGALLARRWALPESVAAVIEHAADPDYRGAHWALSAVVGLSRGRLGDTPSESTPGQDATLAALSIEPRDWDMVLERCRGEIDALGAVARVLSGAGS